MANLQRPLVNQRLYFCRLHLQWLEAQLSEQQLPRQLLERSLGESILLHLVLAYRAYLSEIAEAYAVKEQSFLNADELIAALAVAGFESAEAKELSLLESADRWLGRLLMQFSGISRLDMSVKQNRSASVITSVEQHQEQDFSYLYLSDYFLYLSDLIENQRSRLEEW